MSMPLPPPTPPYPPLPPSLLLSPPRCPSLFGPGVRSQAERLDAFGDWLEEQELPEELRPRTEA